jgi:hypothetical protein
MAEFPFIERSYLYDRGLLASDIVYLMGSPREYIKSRISLLEKGYGFLSKVLDGYLFIFQRGTTQFARENVQLYSLYKKSYLSFTNKDDLDPNELENNILSVQKNIEVIMNDPLNADDSALAEVRQWFGALSDMLYARLEETTFQKEHIHSGFK